MPLARKFQKCGQTDAIVNMGLEHCKIQSGDHFFFNGTDTIGAASLFWGMITATTPSIHITGGFVSSLNGTFNLWEGSTFLTIGANHPSYNNDRNSANSSTMAITKTPTFSTTTNYGTKIFSMVIGSDGANPVGAAGGVYKRENEYILKKDTNYTIEYVSESAANRVSPIFNWYELPT